MVDKTNRPEIGHLWGLLLMTQQYLPSECPELVPYDEWRRLQKMQKNNNLTRCFVNNDGIVLSIPIWYNHIIHGIIKTGKYAGKINLKISSVFRWWSSVGPMLDWSFRSNKDLFRIRLFIRSSLLPGIIKMKPEREHLDFFSELLDKILRTCVPEEKIHDFDMKGVCTGRSVLELLYPVTWGMANVLQSYI